jgi:hypothetical protein
MSDTASGIKLHCTMSNDAGVVVGVVMAMLEKEGKGVI